MSEKCVFLTVLVLLCSENSFSQIPQTDSHWQLKWVDNFNIHDPYMWSISNNRVHQEEPQLYMNYNVWCENGNLVLRVNNLQETCPHNIPREYPNCLSDITYFYTSGRVETMPAYAIRFGYVEARIKVPHYDGLWPAFWTLIKQGLNYQDPGRSASEIDIFEIYAHKNKKKQNHLETNLHHIYNNAIEPSTTFLQEHVLKNFNYTDWHKYAIEWDPVKIIWYVDDTPIRTTYNHGIMDSVRLIMNVAIVSDGQYWPETTPYFARHMLVDYVKTYSLSCNEQETVYEIPDFSVYDYSVKKYIKLGSGTTIPSGTNICLRARNYIELLPGFEVPAEGRLYLDVSPCGTENVNF